MDFSRIRKNILLFFMFAVFLGTAFLGVQKFLNGFEDFFSTKKNSHADVFSGSLEASASDEEKPAVQPPPETKSLPAASKNGVPSKNPILFADAAVSVETGYEPMNVVFKKNEDKRLPVASLTKLMTALVVMENYNLDEKVVVSESAMSQEGEQGSLKLGETLSVKNLLYITLIESSNRAAKALSEVMGTDSFIAVMNGDAQKMGLVNTHFEDASGLNPNSYSSAADLARLSEYLFLNYPLFREIISFKEYNLYLDDGTFHHKLVSTNKFLGEVSGVVGGKTGWTEYAKGCFMVLQENQNGNYFIHIILGADDRFSEMKKLINFVENE